METATLEPVAIPEPTTELIENTSALESWANSLTIANQQEYEAAIKTIQGVKTWRDKIVNFFKPSKDAAFKTHKTIVAAEKSMTDKLDLVERTAKNKIFIFHQEQERIRIAEQQRLQAEADARARAERERLEREAAKLKTPEKREERLEQAAAVVAPVVHVAPTIERVAGTSMRKTWKFRIIDMKAFMNHCLAKERYDLVLPNEKALQAYVTGAKDMAQCPGVEFYTDESIAIGAR